MLPCAREPLQDNCNNFVWPPGLHCVLQAKTDVFRIRETSANATSCSKNNTRMPFWENRQKQTFLHRRRPQKEGLQQPRKQSSQARLSSRFTKANICAAESCGTIFPRQRKRKRRQSLKRKLGRHQTTLLLKTCHSHPSLDAGLAPKVCRKRL